jgi:hypothetical protein
MITKRINQLAINLPTPITRFLKLGNLKMALLIIAIFGLALSAQIYLNQPFTTRLIPALKDGATKISQGILKPKPAPTLPANPYGIAAGSSLTTLSDKDLDAQLSGIKSLGVSWIRLDFDWSQVQPNDKSSYDWAKLDHVADLANQKNLTVLGILDYTPAWARDPRCPDSAKCAPANPQEFADFAAATTKHFSSKNVHNWEIWNEPNSAQFWQPRADPASYTKLLKVTYHSIKNADAQATVITGGLAPEPSDGSNLTPADFLKAIYQAGAKHSFDAVGDHPYTFPVPPSYQTSHAWNQMVTSLRPIMATNGDSSKKIWITEFGSPTGGPGPVATVKNYNLQQSPWHVDEALQAVTLQDALKLYQTYPWAGPFFWYSYKDSGTTNDTNENFFGLTRADGSKKPSYDAFKSFLSSLRN